MFNSPQQSPGQGGGILDSAKMMANVCLALVRILSLPVCVLLHYEYGRKFFGFAASVALIPMLLLAVFGQADNPGPLMTLFFVYLFRCAFARLVWFYRLIFRVPPKCHGYYPGTPILSKLLPSLSLANVMLLEGLIVFVVGISVDELLNRPLGAYLMWAGIGQVGFVIVSYIVQQNRVQDQFDATFEQQAVAEQMQEMGR